MPDFCTCGAQLPEDARFCHRCGKPQREEALTPEPVVIATEHFPATPAAPGFHHPVAVRIGLFVGSIATLLCLAIPFGFVIWLPAAGFVSVYLFTRRTGQSLTVRGGMRMGWIAGILTFVIMTVLFTISAAALAARPGGLAEFMREQFSARSMSTQDLDQILKALANPVDQAIVYVSILLLWFAVFSVFCTAGGAIGAKVLAKD